MVRAESASALPPPPPPTPPPPPEGAPRDLPAPDAHPTERRRICFERMLLDEAVPPQPRNDSSFISIPDHSRPRPQPASVLGRTDGFSGAARECPTSGARELRVHMYQAPWAFASTPPQLLLKEGATLQSCSRAGGRCVAPLCSPPS